MKGKNMVLPPQQPSSTGISEHEDVVISAEHVSKKFCRNLRRSMAYGMVDLSKNLLGLKPHTEQLRKDEFWALDDISFELRRGETLGIIGVNGSGKSTLLRLLTGIFPPDKGEIRVNGRVGALVAVGAGFHPHMTGRENIFLNGSILGMSRKEIEMKFTDIVSFAEIDDFLDAPVSAYSSGMRVRLGFAIAIHCQPDILLVDEVLSVGDLSFRNKSLRHMNEYRQQANAVIFVSHNLEQIRNLCSRVLILNKGQIMFSGPTEEGLVRYEEEARTHRVALTSRTNEKFYSLFGNHQNTKITFLDFGLLGKSGDNAHEISMTTPLNACVNFELTQDIDGLLFAFSVMDESRSKTLIGVMSNDHNKVAFESLKKGKYRLHISIPEHHLVPGVYFLRMGIRNTHSDELYDRIITTQAFKVYSVDNALEKRGLIAVKEQWKLETY